MLSLLARASTSPWLRSWGPRLAALLLGALPAVLAVAQLGRLHPDEVYQSLEPAFFRVHGYGVLAWPLKQARRAVYYHGVGGPGWTWPVVFAIDALVWLAFAGVLLCLAVHYLPQAREAVHHAPAVIRQAVTDIKEWWNRQ